MPKNTYKIIIKTISCCYIFRMLIQEYAEDFHAKNMANQSKLQLSLLEMEQHNLLLNATAYKFMQLKKHDKQRKHHWWVHDINRNWLKI